jgi:hypothetical protein
MDTGEELVVDLERLQDLAKWDLPEIANRWAGANQALHACAVDRARFERPAPLGVIAGGHQLQTTSVGRVYPYFDQLRDALQDIMATSTRNVYEAVDALIQIMNNYAENDDIAKVRFERVAPSHIKRQPVHDAVHDAERPIGG